MARPSGSIRFTPWRSSTFRNSRSVMETPSTSALSAGSSSAAPAGTAAIARCRLSPMLKTSRANLEMAYFAMSSLSRSVRFRRLSISACALSSRSVSSAIWPSRVATSAAAHPRRLRRRRSGRRAFRLGCAALDRAFCVSSAIASSRVLVCRKSAALDRFGRVRWARIKSSPMNGSPISGDRAQKSSQQSANELGRVVHHRELCGRN